MGYGIERNFVFVLVFKIGRKFLNVYWEVLIEREVRFLRKYEEKFC